MILPIDVTDIKNQTCSDQSDLNRSELIFSGLLPEAHPIEPRVCV